MRALLRRFCSNVVTLPFGCLLLLGFQVEYNVDFYTIVVLRL